MGKLDHTQIVMFLSEYFLQDTNKTLVVILTPLPLSSYNLKEIESLGGRVTIKVCDVLSEEVHVLHDIHVQKASGIFLFSDMWADVPLQSDQRTVLRCIGIR